MRQRREAFLRKLTDPPADDKDKAVDAAVEVEASEAECDSSPSCSASGSSLEAYVDNGLISRPSGVVNGTSTCSSQAVQFSINFNFGEY